MYHRHHHTLPSMCSTSSVHHQASSQRDASGSPYRRRFVSSQLDWRVWVGLCFCHCWPLVIVVVDICSRRRTQRQWSLRWRHALACGRGGVAVASGDLFTFNTRKLKWMTKQPSSRPGIWKYLITFQHRRHVAIQEVFCSLCTYNYIVPEFC